MTRRLDAEDVVFLNYGYEEDPPMGLPLAASDEPNRFCIQLYHRTATQPDLSGKQLLEVSCGHGGGASNLMRTLRPASYTGLDFNAKGIAFCRKQASSARAGFRSRRRREPALCRPILRRGDQCRVFARPPAAGAKASLAPR